jgi:Bacterial PH domain
MTEGRTFRRTAGSRVASAGCTVLFVAGAISVGVTSGPTPGLVILSALTLLSLANALGAWADRYTLDDSGITYRNALLQSLGAPPRRVAWEDVVQVREHRGRRFGRLDPQGGALFLVLRSGRRVVLDSLQDFDALRSVVQQRCGAGQ